MLEIDKYRVHIIYKPGSDLGTVTWPSHTNHIESREQKIAGMGVNVNAISTAVNMPACMSIEDIQGTICEDVHLQTLMAYIIQAWPHKEEVDQTMR